jgi:hypothetical protein
MGIPSAGTPYYAEEGRFVQSGSLLDVFGGKHEFLAA